MIDAVPGRGTALDTTLRGSQLTVATGKPFSSGFARATGYFSLLTLACHLSGPWG